MASKFIFSVGVLLAFAGTLTEGRPPVQQQPGRGAPLQPETNDTSDWNLGLEYNRWEPSASLKVFLAFYFILQSFAEPFKALGLCLGFVEGGPQVIFVSLLLCFSFEPLGLLVCNPFHLYGDAAQWWNTVTVALVSTSMDPSVISHRERMEAILWHVNWFMDKFLGLGSI